MKKSLLSTAIAAAIGAMFAIRAETHDVAFDLRMGAGFPGDINRHMFSTMPGLANSSVQAPRLYGDPVIIDTATNSYRGITTADTATFAADGVLVRPYPTQQTSGGMVATIGAAAPNLLQPIDVINEGYVMVKCNVGSPTKNGLVYVWTAANSGNHVQGGFEAAAGANLTLISNMRFNGPPDSLGVCEAAIHAIGL